MTKDNIVLHIDFKTAASVSKIDSPLMKVIVAIALGAVLSTLICSLFLNHVSHLPVIIVLVMFICVIPRLFRDVFFDDMAWPKYVSNVVQKVKPVDVCIDYGFKIHTKSAADFQDGGALYYIVVSGLRSYSNVYKIEYPTKSVLSYASKFPLSLEFGKIDLQKKNPLKAKAYIDPATGNAVMIELDQLRFWVSRIE